MKDISLGEVSLLEVEALLQELRTSRDLLKRTSRKLSLLLFVYYPLVFLIGAFSKRLSTQYASYEGDKQRIDAQLDEQVINLRDEKNSEQLTSLSEHYKSLCRSTSIWEINGTRHIDSVKERTPATLARSRNVVKIRNKRVPYIHNEPLLFIPFPDADVYLFRHFVLIEGQTLRVFQPEELVTTMKLIAYIEEETIPKDTTILRTTWEKVNKDGSIDKRFTGNKALTIVSYGLLTASVSGMKIRLLFSDTDASKRFKAVLALSST